MMRQSMEVLMKVLNKIAKSNEEIIKTIHTTNGIEWLHTTDIKIGDWREWDSKWRQFRSDFKWKSNTYKRCQKFERF